MRLTNTPFLLALLLALVSTSLLATVEANLSWTTCGDAQDVLTVDQLTYTPEDPKRGDVLNVTATGALKEQLEEGVMAFLVVKW